MRYRRFVCVPLGTPIRARYYFCRLGRNSAIHCGISVRGDVFRTIVIYLRDLFGIFVAANQAGERRPPPFVVHRTKSNHPRSTIVSSGTMIERRSCEATATRSRSSAAVIVSSCFRFGMCHPVREHASTRAAAYSQTLASRDRTHTAMCKVQCTVNRLPGNKCHYAVTVISTYS